MDRNGVTQLQACAGRANVRQVCQHSHVPVIIFQRTILTAWLLRLRGELAELRTSSSAVTALREELADAIELSAGHKQQLIAKEKEVS